VRDLRVRLFGHLQTLPLAFFQRTRGGQVLSRVINDTEPDQNGDYRGARFAYPKREPHRGIPGHSHRVVVALDPRGPCLRAPARAHQPSAVVGRVRLRSREQADQRAS